MKLSQSAKNAFYIGALCSVSYLAVYIARTVLGAVTPQMVEAGYTEAYIGSVSSLFFFFYAVGQLINGIIGDRINAKWMMCLGLFLAGVANYTFLKVIATRTVAMIAYGLMGLFLSMIYGPMTKVVSENTEPIHTTRCSLGYEFASFLGSPMAGLLASFLVWETVIGFASIMLFLMALVGFTVFTVLERRKIVQYNVYKAQAEESDTAAGGIKLLFKHQIVRYSIVSVLTGVVRTSVVFWLPTYITQKLGFEASEATGIFSIATLFISLTAFITVFIYEKLGHNMNKTVLIMFISATVWFLLTYFVSLPVLNIIFIVLAIMSSNGAATMMWSRYCPSLRDTGMVSSATGYLDFLSYMAAAVANIIFANAATTLGWDRLVLVWCALMVVGIVTLLPFKRILKRA